MIFPGWDSIDTVSRLSKIFTALSLASLAFLAIFDVLAWAYSNRKDALTEEIQHSAERGHQQQLGDLRNQLEQSASQLEHLKRTTTGRALTEDQSARLSELFKTFPANSIAVTGELNSDESCRFAEQFASLIFAAGKLVGPRGINRAIYKEPFDGIILAVHSQSDSIAPLAGRLQQELHQMGISAPGGIDDSLPAGTLGLRVGRKPPV